jgi:hypothetical protein
MLRFSVWECFNASCAFLLPFFYYIYYIENTYLPWSVQTPLLFPMSNRNVSSPAEKLSTFWKAAGHSNLTPFSISMLWGHGELLILWCLLLDGCFKKCATEEFLMVCLLSPQQLLSAIMVEAQSWDGIKRAGLRRLRGLLRLQREA